MDCKIKPSVIIPAFNEARGIARLLSEILPDDEPADYSVVVACNGCTDNTAKIVRGRFPEVICLELDEASKINAINAAENLGLGYPRVYVDADIVIDKPSIHKLISIASSSDQPILVAPRASIELSRSSWPVKRFYATWRKTRFFIQEGFGSGVYAMNFSARKKFGKFPKVMSDDGYVRKAVGQEYTRVCEECCSRVFAPMDLGSLLKIRTRGKLGKRELSGMMGCAANQESRHKTFLLRPPILGFLVYYTVNAISFLRAYYVYRRTKPYEWGRDNSSRSDAGTESL
ncbi:glycosyltransferase [Biformimicrobium ophioploci]|uniref:Glycosyltransferase 2-like domain-containing protein n=1 Tax=Biformimicrobium ophioploci TaxID=3036711 RepID=A0ABQ6M0B6_9GAMM|nr:glycosyltransferase [Microbulbifer sp. NKW57]GMG87751.1 hypothetical protein MNKW57_20720 [Microbulbifer sp. NKW57]